MMDLPHEYQVTAKAAAEQGVQVSAPNLPTLITAPPTQFGGPGDCWSPEDLLMAATASCFVLSFRAIAKASNMEWISIESEVQGKLENIDRKNLFTQITNTVSLVIPIGANKEKAERLLAKAEQVCLITNSMSADLHLHCAVSMADI